MGKGIIRLALAFFLGLSAVNAVVAGSLLNTQERISSIYEENKNSVVRIKAALDQESAAKIGLKVNPASSIQQVDATTTSSGSGNNKSVLRIGTGVLISKEGHILTSASTVDEAKRVWIEFNNVAYSAEVVGIDKLVNMALLKTSQFPKGAKSINLMGTQKSPVIGSFLVNVSFPLNLPATPILGMLSGVDGYFDQHMFTTSYFRTNITLSPGASGSPFFDLNGGFVGLAIASLPDIQSSYILPAKAIIRIRDDLLFNGKLNYGFVGIEVEQIADIQEGLRIVINQVIPDSPADIAGVRPGDRLVRFGEFDIETIMDVTNAAFFAVPGQFTNVSIVRRGETKNFPMKVIEQPKVDSIVMPELAVHEESKAEKPQAVSAEETTKEIDRSRQAEKMSSVIQPAA